ncbi:MAG: hypothetical protein IH595_02540 [Bacteroidales bacterium]|nr:hypothetical protein [Bacteroidales bacterium]
MKLTQKKGFCCQREFELIDNTVYIKDKKDGEIKEWSVKVEELGWEKFYRAKSRAGFRIMAYLMITLEIAIWMIYFYGPYSRAEETVPVTIFSFIFAGLAAGLFSVKKKKDLHLMGGVKQVSFYANKPSREDVDKFADEIIKRTKSSLLDLYGEINPDLNEKTQMNKLKWLRTRDLISDYEYEQMKKEYWGQRKLMD